MYTVKKHFKKISAFIVIFVTTLSLSGCATVAGDHMRTVCVHTQPQGAGVYIDGQRQGTTPATITLPNYIYGGKSVLLKKEGYHDQTLIINTKFQPCGLWNILFWPGFLLDGATGDFVKIDPSNLNLFTELEAVKSENSAIVQK
jgi:hypothetical protein